ncbi:MAG: polysaccharide deacetylase family protein [Candidatus ainarchaeum sp.]|nr:polysaccharide deacetylase family protein [Candidatus ainarchaeum sp.]
MQINLLRKFARKVIKPISPIMLNNYFSKNQSKLKESIFSISFDCDMPPDMGVLPNLLELLNSYNIKSSFACIGKWIEKYPRIHRKILDDGHEIINHTYSHPNSVFNNNFFNKITQKEQNREIVKFEELCKKYFDYKPVGFRTPHLGNLHGQFVYPLLEELGYLYSSSTMLTRTKSYGLPYYPSKTNFLESSNQNYSVLELPLMVCPEHYFPLFDSWHCFRSNPPAHAKSGDFVDVFKKAVKIIKKHNAVGTFYFDPADVANCKSFEDSLEFLCENKIKVKTCEEVAKSWVKK